MVARWRDDEVADYRTSPTPRATPLQAGAEKAENLFADAQRDTSGLSDLIVFMTDSTDSLLSEQRETP